MTENSGGGAWKRGCAIAGVVVLVLACLGCIVIGFTCRGLYGLGQEQLVNQTIALARAAATEHPRRAEYEAELTNFATVGPSMGMIAMTILQNRVQDVRADGTITPDELDHLMTLIADIDAHQGEIAVGAYPQMR